MGLRDRLLARQLRIEVVTLPGLGEGDDPEDITLRQLPATAWEELVEAHPPTQQQAEQGAPWNYVSFRSALLAASVVTPDGEESLSDKDWDELGSSGAMSAGDLNVLFSVAIRLNDRSPVAAVGKD